MINRHAANCFAALTSIHPQVLEKAAGISVDSRLVKPGDIFVALSGDRVDGHHYIEEAFHKGAIAAVVSKSYSSPLGFALAHVEDTRAFLQKFANIVLAASKATIVAVTGSVGKTTTKNFIAHLVSEKFSTAYSPGNSNSQIGLPLAILNHLEGREKIIVLEMGMSQQGEIANLVKIAPPDMAIITAVGLAHAGNFESLEAIAEAKAELLSHPKTSLGIINRNISAFNSIAKSSRCPVISYGGAESNADYQIIHTNGFFELLEEKRSRIKFDRLPVAGKHNLDNFLAAAIAANKLGVEWPEIAERMKSLELPQKRLQISEKDGIVFVDDSYNASLMSMKAALSSMPLPRAGHRKIAVLGPMAELGKFSEQCHREVADYALSELDLLFCFGAECLPMRECWEKAGKEIRFFENRISLVTALKNTINSGDVVLIKGSFASGAWKIFEEMQYDCPIE